MCVILYIARHGESLGNTGENDSIDPVLSECGKVQAQLLAKRMKKVHIDCILSSPLIRAVQTASETAVVKGMKIEVLPLLFEMGTEAGYEGTGLGNLQKIYPDTILYDDGKPFSASLVEENKEITYKRAKEVIERIKNRFGKDDTVMIFAHGTFNNYLTSAAIGIDVRDDFNFCQENTGLTCIKFLNDGLDRIKAEFINDYSHLIYEKI